MGPLPQLFRPPPSSEYPIHILVTTLARLPSPENITLPQMHLGRFVGDPLDHAIARKLLPDDSAASISALHLNANDR